MTRKHFQALADALRYARPSDPDAQAPVDQWARDVRAIADVCAGSNGMFDRERFYRACGLS